MNTMVERPIALVHYTRAKPRRVLGICFHDMPDVYASFRAAVDAGAARLVMVIPLRPGIEPPEVDDVDLMEGEYIAAKAFFVVEETRSIAMAAIVLRGGVSGLPVANELTEADKAFLDWMAEAAVGLYFSEKKKEQQ